MKANRLVLLAVAGTSMLALTGCTQSGNVAARVGDDTVPTSEVDFLTTMQCDTLDKAAENRPPQGSTQTVPISQVRTGMVNALVQSELNRQLGREPSTLTYDKQRLRSVMDQFEPVAQAGPGEGPRPLPRPGRARSTGASCQVYTLAQRAAGRAGRRPARPRTQVDKAVPGDPGRLPQDVDVEVNPRYGRGRRRCRRVDGPLAVARGVVVRQAGPVLVSPTPPGCASLPANQRCG